MENENKQDFVDVEGTVDHTKEPKTPILEKNAFEKFADNMYKKRVDRYEKKLAKAQEKKTVDKILRAEKVGKIIKPLETAAVVVIIGAVGSILYKKVFGQNCSSGMEENTWYDLDTNEPTEDILPTEENINTTEE